MLRQAINLGSSDQRSPLSFTAHNCYGCFLQDWKSWAVTVSRTQFRGTKSTGRYAWLTPRDMNKKFGKNVAKTMRCELKKKGPEGHWVKKSKDHPDIKADFVCA